MKKSKSKLGPANDAVPEDELVLALLIQNANAWGLRGCRGALFKKNGRAVNLESNPTHCCASGAFALAPEGELSYGVIDGNDGAVLSGGDESYYSAATVGEAFQRAMR